MSGHNPHSRLGQSSNQTWNHLQVPAYMPRQPQVAHMSNERPIVQPAMSWHTPTHTEAALYNYMAAATHKTPLDINPLLPAFVRPSAPFGSVDLSLSRHSTTPSPRNITSSPLISSTPPPPLLSQSSNNLGIDNTDNTKSNTGSGVIQSTGNTKDISTTNLNGDNGPSGNNLMTLPPKQASTSSTGGPPTLPGGLFIRDARQINDEIAKQVSKELLQKSQNEMATMSVESRESLQFATDNIFQNFTKIVNQHQQLQLKEALERENYSLQPPPPQLSSSSSIPTITSTMSMNQTPNVSNLKPKTPEPKLQLLTNPLTMPPRQTIHPLLKSTIPQPLTTDTNTSESQLNFISPVKSTSSVILHSQSSSSSTCSSSSSISPLTELGNPSSTTIIDDNNPDFQSNKQRRRRKPNKTIKMSNNDIEPNSIVDITKNSTDLSTIVPLPLPLTTILPPVLNNQAQTTINQINSTLPITISSSNASTNPVTTSSNMTITTITTTPAAATSNTTTTTPSTLQNSTSFDEVDRPAVVEPICIEKRVYLTTDPLTNNKSPPVDNLVQTNTITEKNKKTLDPKENLNKLSSQNPINDNNLIETNKNNEDYETIDKIAEMIANTAAKSNTNKLIIPANKIISSQPIISMVPVVVIDDVINKSTNKLLNPMETTKLTNISNKNHTTTTEPIEQQSTNNSSYEELENKLEEMFAGIEDDRPTSINTQVPDKQVCQNVLTVDNNNKDNEKIDLDETAPIPSTSSNGGGRNIIKKTSTPTSKPDTVRKSGGGGRAKSSNSKNKRGKANAKSRSKQQSLNKSTTDYVPTNGSTAAAASSSHTLAVTESRFKGPYVHVTTDGSSNVVNAPITEEVAESKSKLKKSFTTQTNNDRNKMRGMHVSTLSMKYDASTTDKTWMCVFCKMGPHRFGLGDLFGPYLISTVCEEYELSQIDPKLDSFKSKRSRIDMIQKRLLPSTSATVNPSKSKKRKSTSEIHTPSNIVDQQQQQLHHHQPSLNSNSTQTNAQTSTTATADQAAINDVENIFFGMTRSSDVNYEVWMHGDCAVWSSGVYIIGSRIIGLEAAVWSSTRHICIFCGKNGAMLSCLERGCDSEIHVPCARNNQWNLCDEDFKCYCNKHYKKPSNNGISIKSTVDATTTIINTNPTIASNTTVANITTNNIESMEKP